MSDIWNDPNVNDALKEGRPSSDIAVLRCPQCGTLGYYNEGSHFSCRRCGTGFECLSEDEEPPLDGSPYIYLDGVMQLEDLGNLEDSAP
jgi:rubrerythrin